jgi:preprotein translocase subunit SecE
MHGRFRAPVSPPERHLEAKEIEEPVMTPKERSVASKEKEEKTTVAYKQPNAFRRYINETVGELRKVSWPTRREATNLTIVVVVVTLVMSLYLGFLDFVFLRLFALILT